MLIDCSFLVLDQFFSSPETRASDPLPAWWEVSNLAILTVFAVVLAVSVFRSVRNGRAVEGMIVGVSDDGIDWLYRVYYEDGPQAFELEFIAKPKRPEGKLQPGDVITLILGPQQTFGPRQFVLCSPATSVSASH